VVEQPIRFGEQLRRRRLDAGLTLTSLAQQVHYSKSQLSKVERGIKTPSQDLARLCDAVLDARGALVDMIREGSSDTEDIVAMVDDEEIWLMQLSAAGESWFQPMNRRHVMAIGAASIPAISIGRSRFSVNVDGTTLLNAFRSIFDQYRQLGQTIEPELLLPTLIAQTHVLQELSRGTGARTREGLLMLGSRYAEYVGWLVQETGKEQAALWWTRRAADLAVAAGDEQFAAYGLVRHALVALYRQDAAKTIGLAQRAQDSRVSPRIRGLAAQREAQGHALAGDYDACMRRLDDARTLLARPLDSEAPVIGTTNLADPAEMISGWCLYDLGRPRAAADIIDKQLVRVPHRATRTRVRYGIRGALAHAAAGEVEHSVRLTAELLDDIFAVGSATIALDLRCLARTLSRYRTSAAVRNLEPRLATALQATIS
jgi:transcriptional regulator with XRE-family HTH domain